LSEGKIVREGSRRQEIKVRKHSKTREELGRNLRSKQTKMI